MRIRMPPFTETQMLSIDTPAAFSRAVAEAARRLRAGQLVALPTETVYGLAANAFDPTAVTRIFAVKGRPAHNPIIIHIANSTLIEQCVRSWPPAAEDLARAFWPGPLTLVLPKSDRVPEIVTAGGPTVALRWPAHPFIQAVIQECGFPLAAPSANLSSALSPTTAEHVRKDLAGKISLIIDGGASSIGIESTVLDLTQHPPRVLRPGMIHRPSLCAVLGTVQETASQPGSRTTLRSPGLLRKHYAPRAKLVVLSWRDAADLADKLQQFPVARNRRRIIAHSQVPTGPQFPAATVSVIPHDPAAFARALYAELHRCDNEGADLIVVETLPDTPEWHGIADRLNRAATA